MHETPEEKTALQDLLDRSYGQAGAHLLSIHTPGRRMRADDVCELLKGVCVLNLATVNTSGHPIVAPVDGLFLGGHFWFGSSHTSQRFRHIRRNPYVSAAYTLGEEISITVHGLAHEIDTRAGEHERLHDYCREVYGRGYDDWDYWGKEPFAWIEPGTMYAIRIAHHESTSRD